MPVATEMSHWPESKGFQNVGRDQTKAIWEELCFRSQRHFPGCHGYLDCGGMC